MAKCTDCGKDDASYLVSLPEIGEPIAWVCDDCKPHVPHGVWMAGREKDYRDHAPWCPQCVTAMRQVRSDKGTIGASETHVAFVCGYCGRVCLQERETLDRLL